MTGTPEAADPRAAAAAELLRELGFAGMSVDVAGHEREVAVLAARGADWQRLTGAEGAFLAARVKALGFRYVTIDLAPRD